MRSTLLRKSLRLRLALWYGGVTFGVVVLVCTYSFAVHSRAHYDDADASVAAASDHVADEVAAAQTSDELSRILEASVHLGAIMRLYEGNKLVARSSGDASAPSLDPVHLDMIISRPAFPRIAAVAPALPHVGEGRGHFDVISGPGRWRLYVVAIPLGTRKLVALVPLAHIDDSVRQFGLLMTVIALVAGIISFGVGLLIAGRALRPVGVLTNAAADIASTKEFSRRVDVTHSRDELGRLSATFNDMLDSLEQAYTSQKRFLSDASHELRTPLTVIQANIELLRHGGAAAADDREHALDEAYRQTMRLPRLVSDLLVLARADSGVALPRTPVELDRIVMTVMGEARHLADGQQLAIKHLEPCTIEGDAERLRQLVLNLVSNAIKYTRSGGRVAVQLSCSDGAAVLTVSDTGSGISPENLEKVFDRFFRTDDARARDPGGTGLGLPIARWIARQHGGDVRLDSQLGKGTTAIVTLPR